jgi:DNA-binding NarL/FixJ family response regulator
MTLTCKGEYSPCTSDGTTEGLPSGDNQSIDAGALRGDDANAGPTGSMTVSINVVAEDPLIREATITHLSKHPDIDARDEGGPAAMLLVLTSEISDGLLDTVASHRWQQDGPNPKLVVVADETVPRRLQRLIDLGLAVLLYRRDTTFTQIADAILLAASGGVHLPLPVQSYLLSHARLLGNDIDARDEQHSDELTDREIDVLRLLSDGFSTRHVATKLNYSERTVKNIVHGVVTRLHLRNRTHAVVHALRTGVL